MKLPTRAPVGSMLSDARSGTEAGGRGGVS